jgi:predicted amidohydrolase
MKHARQIGRSGLGTIVLLMAVLAGSAWASEPRSSMKSMQVACVQLDVQPALADNKQSIIRALVDEAARGTRLVVFAESALTTYDEKIVAALKQEDIDAALADIAAACKRADVYAAVGSAYRENGKWYNGAFVFGPAGKTVKRYAKVHNVSDFYVDGNELAIFRIDDVPTTIMICHDERYPELFRIPVLAGARVGIYMSLESKTEKKRDNYRCQIIARAVENQMAVIQCNAGEGGPDEGSHGHSRIITHEGRVLAEADDKAGTVIRATINPEQSNNSYAQCGAGTPALRAFWAEGLRVLREQNAEYFTEDPNRQDAKNAK